MKIRRKKYGGVPIHITHMSFASYQRLSNWYRITYQIKA